MPCHGNFSLDETKRRTWYNPEAILTDLQAGMTFVDVGCGDGFFSIIAAKKVGEKGRVYAVDIDPSGIEKLQAKAKTLGLNNITAKAGRAEDTVFCTGCADFVFYSMDLHDFNDPAKVLTNARQMVKPTGQMVDLDWKKQEMPFGPPQQIRFSEEKVLEMVETAGFEVKSIGEAGPYHYLIKTKPKL